MTSLKFSGLFWLVCLSYLALLNLPEYPLNYIHKALPLAVLASWLLWQKGKGITIPLLALGFSAMGDILLATSLENSFVFGLGAFLIAHLCYAWAFLRWRQWQRWKVWPLVVLIGYVIVASAILLPASDKLMLPVGVYMLVIMLMAFSALLATNGSHLLLWGASSFIVSDTLIAINKFVSPIPFEGIAIMLTYYLAQFILVKGVIRRLSLDSAS